LLFCIKTMEGDKETQLFDDIEATLVRHLLEAEVGALSEASEDEKYQALVLRLREIERAREKGVPISKVFHLKRKPRKRRRMSKGGKSPRVVYVQEAPKPGTLPMEEMKEWVKKELAKHPKAAKEEMMSREGSMEE